MQESFGNKVVRLAHNVFNPKEPLPPGYTPKIAQEQSVELFNKRIEELKELSTKDPLTGLPDRHGFMPQIEEAIARSTRRREPVSVLFLDLDRFKKINDTYGHNTGDNVLKAVTKLLKESFRGVDKVCRWGGEELVVLLENSGEDGARMRAEVFLGLLRELKILNNEEHLSVTASIGVATRELDDKFDVEEFIYRADKAMYQAKRGRNQVVAYSSIKKED